MSNLPPEVRALLFPEEPYQVAGGKERYHRRPPTVRQRRLLDNTRKPTRRATSKAHATEITRRAKRIQREGYSQPAQVLSAYEVEKRRQLGHAPQGYTEMTHFPEPNGSE